MKVGTSECCPLQGEAKVLLLDGGAGGRAAIVRDFGPSNWGPNTPFREVGKTRGEQSWGYAGTEGH